MTRRTRGRSETMITLAVLAYLLTPAAIKWAMARLWLRSVSGKELSDVLWWSWGWTCFAAPLLGVLMAWANFALLSRLPFLRLPSFAWSLVIGGLIVWVPLFLLWLGFDWWVALRLIAPTEQWARRRVIAWAWSANLLWLPSLAGLLWVFVTSRWTY